MPRERKALKRISNRKLPQKKRLSDYSKNIANEVIKLVPNRNKKNEIKIFTYQFLVTGTIEKQYFSLHQ